MSFQLRVPGRKTIRSSVYVKPRRSLRSKIIITIMSVIALVSLYFLIAPFLPRLAFWISRPHIDATNYQKAAAATKDGKPAQGTNDKPGNRLILPTIGQDSEILDGRNIYVIGKNQGVWRETSAIDPSTPGNIVVAGHRWMGYDIRNVGQFYNLPELKNGDKLYIRWDNKVYEYEVYSSKTVLPTQVDIRDPDPDVPKKLTMYTCYPLGSTAQRFVIEAKQL